MADTSKPHIFQLGGDVSGPGVGQLPVMPQIDLPTVSDMVKLARGNGLISAVPRPQQVQVGPPAPGVAAPPAVDTNTPPNIWAQLGLPNVPSVDDLAQQAAEKAVGLPSGSLDMAAWQRVGVLGGGILAGAACILGGVFLMAK